MSRTLVGLDIGSSGVRAAEFVSGRRRPTLRRFAQVPLPTGVVRAGAVVDAEALTDALKTLWSTGKFGSRNVALGVANAGVLVRQMDLDWMPPADFRKALRYQVQDVLPFSVDEANLDYHLLDELDVTAEDGGTRRVARILLVAASRGMVDAYVEAVRRAGLRTRVVDLLPFALLRARTPMLAAGSDTTEAIVDVGADVVSVVVHTGGVPRYVRMIPGVGGDSVTEAVRARYSWSWEDAERTKVYVGLPGHAHLDHSQLTSLSPRTDGLDHAAQQVVEVAARGLADEISTTLEFFRDSATPDAEVADRVGAAVGRVLLTGSGAELGGFAELLAGRLGVPVERLDVLGHVRAPGRLRLADADVPALAVPAG
ncbi:type IV pilus assembly protein PilM, partial [Nocardioides sp.]|uniref:type IV pilus assembly protein PilM n=1 Tax=Nocardioides sp. TaxID=35761 RepID=UPI002EDAE3C9